MLKQTFVNDRVGTLATDVLSSDFMHSQIGQSYCLTCTMWECNLTSVEVC